MLTLHTRNERQWSARNFRGPELTRERSRSTGRRDAAKSFPEEMTCRKCRAVIIAALILLLAFPVLVCHAEDATAGLPAAVQRYVDSRTAVVAWVDISQIDLDELSGFVEKLNGSPGSSEQTAQLKGVCQALVQLGVGRVYWVSDLTGLMKRPEAAIFPVAPEKQDVVAVLLKALFNDSNCIVVIENGVILAGDIAAVTKLQQPNSGSANADLLAAVSRVKDPHGIVAATPVSAMLPVLGILPQLVDGDVSKVAKAADWLVNLRSVTLSGQLPPSQAVLRISTKSNDVATGLAEFVNAFTHEKLADSADAIKLQVEAHDIVLNITSTEHAISVLSVTQHPGLGNHRHNSMNSLKQIALAMHNFHDNYGHFPPQALADTSGKRLLSWRVLILPYLDQANLYNEFHLDEPWDSEHNIKLVAKMPAVFKPPGLPIDTSEAGKTRFVAPLTKDSAFGRIGGGVRVQDMTDGTSNSLMVVEASPDKAVIWTKPEDVVIDENNPLLSIIANDSDGFTACLCDGSARFFSKGIDTQTLNAMLSISGGEVIDSDKLE